MTWLESLILGLVEGITEFLPISSTGHLIIAQNILGLSPSEGLSAYIIVVQLGAILAVWALYPKRFAELFLGVTEFAKGRFNTPKAILLRNLLLAFLPAAAIGFCFDDLIERYLFSPLPVVLALLVGALIMIGCELRKKPAQPKTLEELSPFGALKIGFWQLLALWPGMSRSMTTIVGGLQGGLSRAAAAEFSFLLGAAVLGAAGVYKIICNYEALFTLGLSQILIGTVAAFISAFFVVKFFVGTLNHYGLLPWAIYRLVLVTILVIL